MTAKERVRKALAPRVTLALALAGALSSAAPAPAQTGLLRGRAAAPVQAAAAPAAGQNPAAAASSVPGQLKLTRIPVNATDPIAVINNEVITRGQLADECVARKGEEILETLVSRRQQQGVGTYLRDAIDKLEDAAAADLITLRGRINDTGLPEPMKKALIARIPAPADPKT